MAGMQNQVYDIDDAWNNFLEDGNINNTVEENISENIRDDNIPKGNDIYISTKTKIAYLSNKIELSDVFWKIKVNDYHIPKEGVIKKQMKFNFIDEVSVIEMEKNLVGVSNVDQLIITQIINPAGRIKFKDIRKVSIGL